MKTTYVIATLAIIALASCKQELAPQDSTDAQEVSSPTASAQTPAQTQPINPQPQQVTAQPGQATMQPVAQAPVSVGKGMNPPHGQPGHRCDIAVGAQLNSTPAKAAPMTVTPQPGTAVAKEIKPTVTPTAPGMNPHHGQPGHRCDISVGAPLNSAPTPAANSIPATLAPTAAPTPTETKTQ